MTANAAGVLTPGETLIDGPDFEDLHLGQRFEDVPTLTLTEGLAATLQAIVGGGCRWRWRTDRTRQRQMCSTGGSWRCWPDDDG